MGLCFVLRGTVIDDYVLLVRGRNDTVVPFEQSLIIAHALREAGKSVELGTLNHEDHWLSRGDTRLQLLQSVSGFREKYNQPQWARAVRLAICAAVHPDSVMPQPAKAAEADPERVL